MGSGDFKVLRECGAFDCGPLREVRGKWQTVRGRLKADLRVHIQNDEGEWLATRAGLCLEPELLDDLDAMLRELLKTRDAAMQRAAGDEEKD